MPRQFGSSGFPGQIDPATEELYLRAVRPNPDPVTTSHEVDPRSYGTARSLGVGDERGEMVIPQIVNGFLLTPKDAIEHARRTGEHFGRFDTIEHANQAGQRIHELQELHQDLLQAGRNRHDQAVYDQLMLMMKSR